MADVPVIEMRVGAPLPVLGQGTWHMGERISERKREIAALRVGIQLAMTLIDTAEMYGDGGAEQVVAAAIEGVAPRPYIVSKVYPHNASLRGTIEACNRSLARLQVERIDLYLLHWRGSHPLRDTVKAFEQLKAAGKIAAWGVSNFDTADMKEMWSVPHGDQCAANQVLYNVAQRGIEFDLLPWCRRHEVAVMAYCPLDQAGRLLRSSALQKIAARHGGKTTPAQVALAWLLQQPGVAAIPKASSEKHVRENRAALELTLTSADLAEIDAAFPPPKRKTSLAMT